MNFSKEEKIHGIIHTASATAAAIGGGMAQLPGSDAVLLMPLQGSMIAGIALVHGHAIDKAMATSLLGTFAATIGGRTVSQFLVGWIPGIGNIVNASTAAGLTEAVGWAANAYFRDLAK